ncbi:DNA methyltransferase [Streptococcus salivarius]|uniref:DNA methyltransferase n=1 Tax=Streptococcus salivarius TaxID=1304 RepID=UPI0009D73B10|nr:site-specific DNA-methyltransferase [Streptococcus salivarius]
MKQELERLLSQKDEFLVEGMLNKNKLAELARRYDPTLLNLLMSEPTISNHFFSTLEEGILIFKKDTFLQFLNNKEFLPDSFTAYKTKIGLATSDNRYLSENNEVVLNFPYKDCVLEGGQTKEDVKRQELFFNETLAPSEINRLLDDKVLTNFKRFDKDGEHEVEELNNTDNLIIKGNNLIALHSLKKRFAGRIKMIYIDPPYNTGKDSFNYNDHFNHSSWLTFMKNRLEVAWDLLAEDGTIWISIDDSESHYLKVLADSVFGRENFLNEVIWQRAYAPVNLKKTFSRSHDAILVYAKNNSSEKELNKLPRDEVASNRYKNPDNDPRGVWQSDNLSVGPAVESNIYEIITPSGRSVYPPEGRSWLFNKTRFREFLDDNRIWFGQDGNNVPRIKRFLSEVKDGVVAQTLWTYQEVGHNQDAKKEIKNLFEGQAVFGTPKPEKLIQRIIQLGSDEGDLILDFFMGSATTQAVAHKMNRQYIGIEQMDYIETVAVERLKKVIDGEQGGISKDVDWQGGGSFVYCELKNDAQDFKESILKATTTEELLELFNTAKTSSFLSYRVDPKKLKEAEFKELSLAEQKQVLSELIDNNNLYVNYSDIEDSSFAISPQEKALNRDFYGEV